MQVVHRSSHRLNQLQPGDLVHRYVDRAAEATVAERSFAVGLPGFFKEEIGFIREPARR